MYTVVAETDYREWRLIDRAAVCGYIFQFLCTK